MGKLDRIGKKLSIKITWIGRLSDNKPIYRVYLTNQYNPYLLPFR